MISFEFYGSWFSQLAYWVGGFIGLSNEKVLITSLRRDGEWEGDWYVLWGR